MEATLATDAGIGSVSSGNSVEVNIVIPENFSMYLVLIMFLMF